MYQCLLGRPEAELLGRFGEAEPPPGQNNICSCIFKCFFIFLWNLDGFHSAQKFAVIAAAESLHRVTFHQPHSTSP